MLCQMAELEDGTKAFAAADAAKLQRELPESVLNEVELFLFGLGADTEHRRRKKRLKQDKWTFYEFHLACELGMTVSRLRTELTDAELVYFAAFHQIKAEEEQKAKRSRKEQSAVALRQSSGRG